MKRETIYNALHCYKELVESDMAYIEQREQILKEIDQLIAENRLEYLRQQINNENISYEELAELQSLAEYIDPSDVRLLEWAGVPEFN